MKCLFLLGAFLALTLAQSADVFDLLSQPVEANLDETNSQDSIDTFSPEDSSEESYLEEDSPDSPAASEGEVLISNVGEPALIAVGEITAPESPQPVNEEEPSDKSGNTLLDTSNAALNTISSEPLLKESAKPKEPAPAEDPESENSISETETEEDDSESESESEESSESDSEEVQSEPKTPALSSTSAPSLVPSTTEAPIQPSTLLPKTFTFFPVTSRTQAPTTIIPSTFASSSSSTQSPTLPPIPILFQSFSSTAAPTTELASEATTSSTPEPKPSSTAAPTQAPSSTLLPNTQAPLRFTFAPSTQSTTRAPLLFRPFSPTLSPLPNLQSRINKIASAARPAQQAPVLKVITPSAAPSPPGPTISVQIVSSPEPPAEAPTVLLRKQNYNIYQNGKDRAAKTLRYDNYINPDNSYSYLYETDNGIYGQADGFLRDFGDGQFGNIVTGGFSWINPEGYEIAIKYIADENGYHPEGDAIPTAPPIPPLIVKSLRYLKQYYPEIEI